MPHILVVCTANICRSPVAEALIRTRLASKGLTEKWGWTVESAGTWAQKVRAPSKNSVILMEKKGIDISQHRAQIVSQELMAKSDLVICMEAGHVEALHAEFPDFRDKTRFFSEIAGRKYSISDPYGKPIEEYEAMVKEVEKLLDFGMASIVQWARDGEAARQTAF